MKNFMGVEADSQWKRNWNKRLWVVCQHVDLVLLYESRCKPPKMNQNLRALTHTHIKRRLGRHPAGQLPRNECKKSANPHSHPYTWSKNPYSPIAKTIWEKNPIALVFKSLVLVMPSLSPFFHVPLFSATLHISCQVTHPWSRGWD